MTNHNGPPPAFQRRQEIVHGVHWNFIDEGQGPLLVLLHGFPFLSHAFRHVIAPLVAAGWRVVAPDLPGYGRSGCPADVRRHMAIELARDIATLITLCGADSAVLIGHDVGSTLSFTTALAYPQAVRGLVLLNTPPVPRSGVSPRTSWQAIREQSGGMFYQEYFTTDEAVLELNRDIRTSLLATMYSISGTAATPHRWRSVLRQGEGFLHTVHAPTHLPAWLSPASLDHYVAEYRRHGFGGALMPYRSRELNWQATAHGPTHGPHHPALFLGGASDPALERLQPALEALPTTMPGLQSRVLLQGVGHCLPEEAPEQMLACMLPFLNTLAQSWRP